MDLGLTDKVALVTGSYRGTGAGIARSLAAEGAVVLVHGLEPGQAEEVASDIIAGGGHAHVVVGDIRTEDGTAAMVADVRAQLVVGGRDHVDIVVNNYGNTDHASDWDSADTATWHGSYDINVVSAFRVTQAFVPDMRATGWGHVVVMSTIGATRPGDTIPEYYTAKGALPSMAVGLAKHVAGTGITVNCVSPGIIATAEVVASYTKRAERDRARHRLGQRAGADSGRAHGQPDRPRPDPRRRRSLRDLRGERTRVAPQRRAPPTRRRRVRRGDLIARHSCWVASASSMIATARS